MYQPSRCCHSYLTLIPGTTRGAGASRHRLRLPHHRTNHPEPPDRISLCLPFRYKRSDLLRSVGVHETAFAFNR